MIGPRREANEMTDHAVVTRQEWLAAREELLEEYPEDTVRA
jgi:predicted dithiol-disulfide oxidoreductase (DUF899 family)